MTIMINTSVHAQFKKKQDTIELNKKNKIGQQKKNEKRGSETEKAVRTGLHLFPVLWESTPVWVARLLFFFCMKSFQHNKPVWQEGGQNEEDGFIFKIPFFLWLL